MLHNEISKDPLTNVFDNRAIIAKLGSSRKVNFILINIDSFSSINNAYGYQIGDEVLKSIARYLNILKTGNAQVYRYCSDKFVLIDDENTEEKDAILLVESVLSFFADTEIVIDEDIEMKLSLSIGVSRSIGTINITQAEMAIREAREMKRSYHIFDPNSQFVHNSQQHIYWVHKLREAVAEENLIAYFQPIINNKTHLIEKFECLVRIHDDEEVISPFLFLQAAKASGNLSYVTKSLIMQSFKKFSTNDYEFSINITGEDLQLEYLEEFLLKYVNKYSIEPSRVVLEMLEDITTLTKGTYLDQLNKLREHGFKIAIDDFGAENSNFSRLLEIEPDYLKIDGAFIKNLIEDKKSQIIVEAIVLICKKSNIKMIAEFVHNEQTQKMVESLGIDYSQGFYFGAPELELCKQL